MGNRKNKNFKFYWPLRKHRYPGIAKNHQTEIRSKNWKYNICICLLLFFFFNDNLDAEII